MKKTAIISLVILAALLPGCSRLSSDTPYADSGNIIHVGGMEADGLVAEVAATKAPVDAETVDWLQAPLYNGLDITYGKADRTNKRVAILKLLREGSSYKTSAGGFAEYSFLYRHETTGEETDLPAIWYDNGPHFFEGVYVPGTIQYVSPNTVTVVYDSESGTAKALNTDQHGDNYTLLTQYLAMPAGFTLNATVERIKLPFRHRLARVLAYILIDPVMEGVTLRGYKKDAEGHDVDLEDATTTSIRFCNVKVLEGVLQSQDAVLHHEIFTPQWGEVRKAVPHFVEERGSYNDETNTSVTGYENDFIAFYDTQTKEYVHPTDPTWSTLNGLMYTNGMNGTTQKLSYGKVPVYDLIVRPTYTSSTRVMYDEVTPFDATIKNKIDFEITLSNGLHYTKEFEFDLDANYQTVVYLHISREHVDYNSSGSVLWQETVGYDDWYGVNNQNGNTLSFAGSGWQRAYTAGASFDENVTDGHYYYHDTEDEEAQYVTDEKWIEMLMEAHQGGSHHGDYFILKKDMNIPAAAFPNNFVFTGHLDGQDHTITITDATGETAVFAGLDGKYSTAQESDITATWEANVHKEGSCWVPFKTATDGWRAEIINTKFSLSAGKLFTDDAPITGYLHNCWLNNEHITDYTPSIPEY